MKTISLRMFRERAAEIVEPVEITVQNRDDGRLKIIGQFFPYEWRPGRAGDAVGAARQLDRRTTPDGKKEVGPR